jgi:hypothetical protein
LLASQGTPILPSYQSSVLMNLKFKKKIVFNIQNRETYSSNNIFELFLIDNKIKS